MNSDAGVENVSVPGRLDSLGVEKFNSIELFNGSIEYFNSVINNDIAFLTVDNIACSFFLQCLQFLITYPYDSSKSWESDSMCPWLRGKS